MNFHDDGFAEIQAEDAQQRFCVDKESSAALINFVGVFVDDVHEFFYAFGHTEFDFNRFHNFSSLMSYKGYPLPLRVYYNEFLQKKQPFCDTKFLYGQIVAICDFFC